MYNFRSFVDKYIGTHHMQSNFRNIIHNIGGTQVNF